MDRPNSWCYSGFVDPAGGVQYLVPDAETLSRNDPTGIAIAEQINDVNQKRASLSFFRPMETASENDADFEPNTEYGVYINWGIFDSHEDQEETKVRGMTNP